MTNAYSNLSGSLLERAERVIDSEVRPYIEMDGGAIKIISYSDGVLYVRLSGACTGCPSSALTLKKGVERKVCECLPEIERVELDGIDDPGTQGNISTTMYEL